MADDDDDDFEDLWEGLSDDDDDESNINVSANLLGGGGGDTGGDKFDKAAVRAVHLGDVDEGRVTWVAPKFSGLTNSEKVTIASKHWDTSDVEPAPGPKPPSRPNSADPRWSADTWL